MENQKLNEKVNDSALALETVIELENHIFIHSPDKKRTDNHACYKCGRSPDHHRWSKCINHGVTEVLSG